MLHNKKIWLLTWAILLIAQDLNAEIINDGKFSYKLESEPGWVEKLPISLNKQMDTADKSIYFLLSNNQVNLTEKDKHIFYRYAAVPLTQKGVEDLSQIQIDYSPEYNELILHTIKIHRDGKVINKLVNSDIKLMQREEEMEQLIYNGVVTMLIVLKDVRVGDVIEHSFSRTGSNPILGDKYFGYFSMAWSVPVDRIEVRVIHPKNKKIYAHRNGFTEPVKQNKTGQYIEKKWIRKKIPAIYDDGEYPEWFKLYPWLELSEYKDWSEIVNWSLPHYQKEQSLSKELTDQVKHWKSTLKSKQSYLKEALRFTQDSVRYFGVEYGQNSHLPSHPNEVFERRYGDCKDKSLLLVSLLNKNNIEAAPALVSTRHTQQLEDMLPSPGAFNHVITYVNIEGKTYWLDPTLTYQHGDLDLIGGVPYKKALIIEKGKKRLSDIEFAGKNHFVKIKQKYIIENYQSPVIMKIDYKYSGREAEIMRRNIASNGESELAKNFLDYYSKYYPKLKIKNDLIFNDDKKMNTLSFVGEYEVPDFFSVKNNESYIELNGDFIRQFTELPRTIKRKSPLWQYHPIIVDHELIVKYPEKLSWDLNLDPVVLSNNSLSYKRTLQAEGDQVKLNHFYTTKIDSVSLENIPSHIDDLTKINDALYYPLVLSRPVGSREDRLKNVLKNLMNKNK